VTGFAILRTAEAYKGLGGFFTRSANWLRPSTVSVLRIQIYKKEASDRE
jgi:hypothetical protein